MASRRMLRFALGLKGCEVLESGDLDESLALLEKRRIDLLLVSLYAQDPFGSGLLEYLSAARVTAALPVILVGDSLLRTEYQETLWRGTAWLDRPFRVSELMGLVDNLFKQLPLPQDEQLT
jgi:DNA-binding response OmpR family regulator